VISGQLPVTSGTNIHAAQVAWAAPQKIVAAGIADPGMASQPWSATLLQKQTKKSIPHTLIIFHSAVPA
jgi:hypothetical protein